MLLAATAPLVGSCGAAAAAAAASALPAGLYHGQNALLLSYIDGGKVHRSILRLLLLGTRLSAMLLLLRPLLRCCMRCLRLPLVL